MIGIDDLDDLLRDAMAAHTRDVLLDPGAAQRALRAARRSRRVRVGLTLATALAVTAVVPITAYELAQARTAKVSITPAQSVPPPQHCLASEVQLLPSPAPAGPLHRVGSMAGGGEQLLWVGADGKLYVGYRETACRPARAMVSLPLSVLASQEVLLEWIRGAPESAHRPIRTLVVGAVRGQATRVELRLPHGIVRASIAPDPTGHGTLFWTLTEDFDEQGRVADPNAARIFGTTISSIGVTAYDGNRLTIS